LVTGRNKIHFTTALPFANFTSDFSLNFTAPFSVASVLSATARLDHDAFSYHRDEGNSTTPIDLDPFADAFPVVRH
jgi:hypothetical protein